jgi:eukaryotic-like serine/threonine-protein kinase
MALPAGTRLGPYELTTQIGAGGMGEVYKARDTRLDRTVAVKVLPASAAADPDRRARLEREARAISSLNHPNICALFDVGNQDGVEYLVMEFLEGESLARRVTKGPLPLEQVLRVGIDIASALERAHRQGIVHRDLKPANVKLREDGTVKVLDFGLAKALDPGPPRPRPRRSPTRRR